MRLGAYPAKLAGNSHVAAIYGKNEISERHRHRYEVNVAYRNALEEGGLVFSGMSPDNLLPEIFGQRRDQRPRGNITSPAGRCRNDRANRPPRPMMAGIQLRSVADARRSTPRKDHPGNELSDFRDILRQCDPVSHHQCSYRSPKPAGGIFSQLTLPD